MSLVYIDFSGTYGAYLQETFVSVMKSRNSSFSYQLCVKYFCH